VTTPDQAFETYLALWNTTDEAQCREIADQSLTEDVVVEYPSFQAYGRAEVVATATRFHQDNPGAQIVLISGAEGHHGWARGAWRVVSADGTARGEGQTMLELADDGRIRRAIGFRNPLPKRP
jgi:hypothetical protein